MQSPSKNREAAFMISYDLGGRISIISNRMSRLLELIETGQISILTLSTLPSSLSPANQEGFDQPRRSYLLEELSNNRDVPR
jgi:hypothetical protein